MCHPDPLVMPAWELCQGYGNGVCNHWWGMPAVELGVEEGGMCAGIFLGWPTMFPSCLNPTLERWIPRSATAELHATCPEVTPQGPCLSENTGQRAGNLFSLASCVHTLCHVPSALALLKCLLILRVDGPCPFTTTYLGTCSFYLWECCFSSCVTWWILLSL